MSSEKEPYDDSGSDASIPSSQDTERVNSELDNETNETDIVQLEIVTQCVQRNEKVWAVIEQDPAYLTSKLIFNCYHSDTITIFFQKLPEKCCYHLLSKA